MAQAAKLFHSRDSEAETLNRRVRPSEDQRAYLLKHKDELEVWFMADMADLGMEVSTFIQGSYRFHTLIKPLVSGDEYDVDLGLYFRGKSYADVEPLDLREKVQKSLIRYGEGCDETKNIEEPKERCCRATYNESFHIDVPVYHETPAGQIVRLATLSNGWEKSDPESMLDWFGDAIEGISSDRAMIRRLIRYMKAWAALTFRTCGTQPSSLMLTILVVDACQHEVAEDDEDDDALEKVVRTIYERLVLDRSVPNPIAGDSDSDVNRLSENDHIIFVEQLAKFLDAAARANECDSPAEAAVVWSEVFSYVFPLPDDLGVLTTASNGVQVASPRFLIRMYQLDVKTLDRTYEDQVPHARIDEWMRFEMANPEVIPHGAKIKWVVRNSGAEAMAISDLGHSSDDEGDFHQLERAAYRGRHYMDCEVWLHGRLRSLTRVPVNIDRIVTQSRVSPRRPAYTQLMKRR